MTASVTDTAGTIRVKVDSGDIVIPQNASGFTNALAWVMYEDTAGAATTDPVICFGDFGTARSIVTGALTIDFEDVNGSTVFEY